MVTTGTTIPMLATSKTAPINIITRSPAMVTFCFLSSNTFNFLIILPIPPFPYLHNHAVHPLGKLRAQA